MAVLASVLLTLLSVGAAFGIQAASDAIDRKKVAKGEMSPDKMMSLINKKLSVLQRKSAEAYNTALDKISQMPAIMEAGSLKDYMNKVRDKASDTLRTARQNYTNVENAVSDLKNRTVTLANQSDSYKASKVGQKEYQSLKEDADNTIKKFSQEVQNVEKTI